MIIAPGLVLLFLSGPAATAQVMSGGQYSITSSVQASGGGASTGSGNKVIEGTAGESAAGGPYSVANFTHEAGFWPTTLASVAAMPSPTPTGTPPPNTIQFSAANYSVLEALTATRLRSHARATPPGLLQSIT